MARRKHTNAVKTIYKGVEYASKLEVTMVMLLESKNIPYIYERTIELFAEETYTGSIYLRSQKRSKALKDNRRMEKRVYTPDFIDPKGRWIIEVKGWKSSSFSLRWRIFLAKMNNLKNPPMLFMPRNKADCIQTFDIINAKF